MRRVKKRSKVEKYQNLQEMIVSNQNPKVKLVRALLQRPQARREHRAFVIEGVRLAEEALMAKCPAKFVLYTPDLSERGKAVVEGFSTRGVPTEMVSERVFRSTSETKTPQGILVVLSAIIFDPPASMDFILILDSIQDPGNLGTILRTAAAVGCNAVFLTPGTVDPFSPKVVRAAMGAHFRLPIRQTTWEETRTLVQQQSLQCILASPDAVTSYTKADLRVPLALILGSEAEGTSAHAHELADLHISIPMPGGMESLNVAVAAGVLMYEVIRQRLNSIKRKEISL